MKLPLFTLSLFTAGLLQAQIQIDIVDPDVTEEPSDVAAPEAVGHGRPDQNSPDTDLLFFLNGDRLSGVLENVDDENGLVWKHPDAASETVFVLDNLKEIQFKYDPDKVDDLATLPRVELTNGDQYRGRIVRMDAESLEIDSPLGGKIKLRSDMIRSIRPVAGSTAVYSGPNSIEEWDQNNSGDNKWEFKNNAIYSSNHNQIAGMKLENLPDKISFEFIMEWKGNPNLMVGFWGQDTMNVNQNCYTLAIQNSYLRCYRNYNKIGRNDLGNAQVRQEMQDGKVDVQLLLNRENKEVLVMFDGNLVARWTDTFDGKIKGDAIMFGSMGNTPMKVSRISVREWDGELKMDSPDKPQPLDQLITTNGDVFAGNLEKIEMDVLYFKNEYAVFEVPVDRVSEISFAKSSRAVPRLQAGDVEIFFPNKERITLKLLKLDGLQMLGTSEVSGEVTLQKKYFAEMKMNPYDERHNVEEDGW